MNQYPNAMAKTLLYVGFSLLITLIGFILGMVLIPPTMANTLSIACSIIILVLTFVLFFSFRKKQSVRFPMWYVYIYAFIEGIILYPIILTYLAQLGVVIVLSVFVGTIVWVFILGLIALKSNGKFLNIGGFLFIGLIVELILSLIGIFFFNDFIMVLISAFGVLIFSGYVLFDISALKTYEESGAIQERDDISIFVLNIYLDIVALFIRLLRIVSYILNRD